MVAVPILFAAIVEGETDLAPPNPFVTLKLVDTSAGLFPPEVTRSPAEILLVNVPDASVAGVVT
jgi:hypothetical protein